MTQEPPTDPWGALMRAAQQGDAAAYAQLLREITPRIRQIVHRQRGFAGIADAEDLVQDVLLSVHSVRATYDPARPFTPWLLAIVRNRLADGARRYARTARREVPFDETAVTFAALEANMETGDIGDPDALRRAVRALPVAQREAIELTKIGELSLEEAARVSGSSVGALKVATHRAMTTLRRTLKVKSS